jgi:leader peptidase (prepilin peptidase)/N-methyltransferase
VQYPIIEFLNCAVYVALFWKFDATPPFIFFAALSSVMIVLAVIDIYHMLLPNRVVAVVAVLGLIYVLMPEKILAPEMKTVIDNMTFSIKADNNLECGFGLGILENAYLDRLLDALLGALAGGGVFWLIALVTRGSMGGGDIKLMAALGLWFGLKGIAMIALLAFVIGSVISLIIVKIKKGGRKTAVPFGPFIILASFITIFFYSPLVNIYLRLAGFN